MDLKISDNESNPSNENFKKEFENCFKGMDASDLFLQMFNSFGNAAAVLNDKRQIVISNTSFLETIGFNSVEELLGKRPGEALSCLHALNSGQCGISNNCMFCGALNAIKDSQSKRKPVSNEFLLTTKIKGEHYSNEYSIDAVPISLSGKPYLILYLKDISNEKRKKALERIFFHDILNRVGNINNIIYLINNEEIPNHLQHYLQLADNIAQDITKEIFYQRELASAESGELKVNIVEINMLEFFNKLEDEFINAFKLNGISLVFEHKKDPLFISSDPILLNRILINVIKNAVEASTEGQIVDVKYEIIENKIRFAVQNCSFIPPDKQLQIFQRSFSTKGADRGLGTYSIKLLTERYLKGKVYFNSTPEDGTWFYVEILG